MREIVEDWEIELVEKTTKKVTEDSNRKFAKILKKNNFTDEQIASDMSLPLEQVKEYLSE